MKHSKKSGKAFAKPSSEACRSTGDIARWARETAEQMGFSLNGGRFDFVCFLIASSVVGAHELQIADMLGCEITRAIEWAGNLRQSGLWSGDGGVAFAHWFKATCGKTAFLMDTLVAEGRVTRRIEPGRGAVYRAVKYDPPFEDN